ncbi:MCP four helix bundle domain-containing protein, partial [Curvibacter sp. CHRR-16]|uniref:methyl-accepting chemotaxis protein n=1 Tax=Curvibacter sp. CHRR-16 TaxID=2835872 RepID=UPI001BDB4FFF
MLLALGVAVALTGFFSMRSMNTQAKITAQEWMPKVELANQLRAEFGNLRILEFRHVLNTEDAVKATIDKAITAQLQVVQSKRQLYTETGVVDEEEKQLYQAFGAALDQYLAVSKKVLEMSNRYDINQAQMVLETDGQKAYDAANSSLDKLSKRISSGSQNSAHASESAYERSLAIVFLVVVLEIVVALVLSWRIAKAIVAPLQQAVEATGRIAQGDLTHQLDNQRNDEVGQLLTAMSSMQDSLIQVVSKVRSSSDSVANASAEIASGNQDLSSRTESQASALEETAASMEELGSTVRQNADSSSQANQLAQNASNVATQGGQVV